MILLPKSLSEKWSWSIGLRNLLSDRLKMQNGWIGVEMGLAWLAEKLRKVQ